MNSMNRFPAGIWFFLTIVLTILAGCTASKKVIKAPLKEEGEMYLLQKLKDNELKFNTLSAKFEADYIYEKNKTTVSGQLRILHDSIIWLSVTPALGIEMVRFVLTPDSIFYLNRINNTYLEKPFSFINELLNKAIDFDMAQSFLIGNDFALYETGNFKATIDKDEYRLNTQERRKIRKYVRRGEKDVTIPIQSIWLNPETFKISRVMLKEADRDPRKFTATYSLMQNIDNQLVPGNLEFIAETIDKNIKIKIGYSRIVIDQEITVPYKVPANYEKVETLKPKNQDE